MPQQWVIQAGHQNCQSNCEDWARTGTGAPGEIDWTPRITGAVVALLKGRGIDAITADANWNCDARRVEKYDGFVAIHYQANLPTASGFFVGAQDPTVDGVAHYSGLLVAKLAWRYGHDTGLIWRPGWNNPNITDYYCFRDNNAQTPGALIECGVGAPGAPDHDFLWSDAGQHKVANSIADGITDYMSLFATPAKPAAPIKTTLEQEVQALRVAVDNIGHSVEGMQ